MMPLAPWVESPLAEAIGWALLHSLWQGAAISAALAAALAATRSPRVRYAAACAALAAMLAAFGLTLIHVAPESPDRARVPGTPAFRAWIAGNGLNGGGRPYEGIAAAVPWLAPFWMAGVWVFYLRHLAGWMSLRRLRRRGVCCAPERWQQELARLAARLRLSRPVLLLESSLADVPMVLGHFRPLILMPVGLLAGMPAKQVEAVLLHELAHIRRYDYLVNLFQRAAEGLLFYHPVVWWISRVIRAEREHCCDDMAVAVNGDAHGYASALAALEQNRWSGRAPAVAATGGNLMKRIRRLLYPERPHGAWTPLLAALILLATAAAALAAWQQDPAQLHRNSAAQTPYIKWLNEDALYIATDEERAAYLKLATSEEREKFIEQFWLRRDPTPGTSRNEAKVEHYRRIEYVNKRFGTPSKPGWQTDRGHLYIVYGPPDQMEVHWTPYPVEVWLYSHVDGIGDNVKITFIDRGGTGDYRIAPGK